MNDGPFLAYLPLLQRGDLIFTALALYYQMHPGISPATARDAIQGPNYSGLYQRVLGSDVTLTAYRIFGGCTEQQVLEQHTLFGIYSRCMDPKMAKDWAENQSVDPRDVTRSVLRVAGRNRIQLVTQHLRSCERCVQIDVEYRGFAAWRVLHQIPSIDHCPEHGNLLRDEVVRGSCTDYLASQLRLPGGPAIPSESDGFRGNDTAFGRILELPEIAIKDFQRRNDDS